MTRFVSVCVAVMGVIASARIAHAEGMLPNGAELKFERFFILDSDGEYVEPPTPDDRRFYLNFAHCACGKAMAGPEQTFRYEVTISATTGTGRPAEVWVGTNCNDDTLRAMQCRKIESAGIRDIDALLVSPANVDLTLFDVVNATMTEASCTEKEGDALVWLLVDADGDGSFEYFKSQPVAGTATNMDVTKVDTLKPPLPTDFNAQSGEGSVKISWTAPTGGATDIYYYQALCANEDGTPLEKNGPEPKYQTTDMLCGLEQGITLTEASIEGGDGTAVTALPEGFRTLDPFFVCGEAPATAPSLSIEGLENDKPYIVGLLVMDQYGNVTGVYFNRTVIPKPVTDLWEDLHDRNSAVDGGCLLSQTYGEGNPLTRVLRDFRDTTLARTAYGRALTRAYYATLGRIDVGGSLVLRVLAGLYLLPLVILALLWHALTLPGMLALFALLACWRRLPRARLRRLVLAAALLVPGLANADDFEPYWQTDEADDASLLDFGEVKWHAGIRVGPYIPEIDLQAGLNALTGKGPYEAMFGDYWLRDDTGELKKHERAVWQVLPMLDVDYVLWDGLGQVTVGGSIGYMQKSAYAYLDGTNQDQAMRERSSASRNTFRLIPTAATVGYRFTALDDLYGIPVVPYVRGGLSYYVWWMKAPNGDVSKVCEDMAVDGSCAKSDKAYGGSLGFQGSVGIAIRAERIDADAAMSMRNSGIVHAGFYAELSYAKVDGFGSDSKLSVGDNTWFAGVDFEF